MPKYRGRTDNDKVQIFDKEKNHGQEHEHEKSISRESLKMKDIVNKYDKAIRDFDKQTRLFENRLKFLKRTDNHRHQSP